MCIPADSLFTDEPWQRSAMLPANPRHLALFQAAQPRPVQTMTAPVDVPRVLGEPKGHVQRTRMSRAGDNVRIPGRFGDPAVATKIVLLRYTIKQQSWGHRRLSEKPTELEMNFIDAAHIKKSVSFCPPPLPPPSRNYRNCFPFPLSKSAGMKVNVKT